jgi:hypothetical protein
VLSTCHKGSTVEAKVPKKVAGHGNEREHGFRQGLGWSFHPYEQFE